MLPIRAAGETGRPTFLFSLPKKSGRAGAKRGGKVTTAALAMVRGTSLDTGAFLDRLKKVKPENQ